MAEVFLCETGQLSAASKRELRKAGICVVEVADPAKCEFIRSTETISHDDMMWACMDALRRDFGTYSDGRKQREQLAQNMFRIILHQRKPGQVGYPEPKAEGK